ncbi:MCP four helix bundle domain-containing protein [Rhizobium nepotum]|uniref:Uncharacterized protein n=1 Tax=Rhizobium nepotum 39/7 TaxID=1368418 RepID=A0ABR5CMF7_9HYPH|nr:hypothetical protein [Rhizobium nepotum]KJF65889.1 hypothetical protein RS75_20535 [Rhizobium nepotum 39/7]
MKLAAKLVNDSLLAYGKAGENMITFSKVGNYQQAGSMLESMGPIIAPAQSAFDTLLESNNAAVIAATNVMNSTSTPATLTTFVVIAMVTLLLVLLRFMCCAGSPDRFVRLPPR